MKYKIVALLLTFFSAGSVKSQILDSISEQVTVRDSVLGIVYQVNPKFIKQRKESKELILSDADHLVHFSHNLWLKDSVYIDNISDSLYFNLSYEGSPGDTSYLFFSHSILITSDMKESDVLMKVYHGDKLVLKKTLGTALETSGPFKDDENIRVAFSKKGFMTKKVFVRTEGIDDEAYEVVIDMSPSMLKSNLFRKFNGMDPFEQPVAIIRVSPIGNLTYDLEYIKNRLEIINSYLKKQPR
jgi:hypothetical protein